MSAGAGVVERCELGLDAVAYLRSYLARNAEVGNLLGPLVSRGDLEAGSTWAFLPSATSERARADFAAGGLVPQGRRVQDADGTAFAYLRTDLLDIPVIEWAAGQLDNDDSGRAVICVEDAISRRSHLARAPSELSLPTVICGDHLYVYASSPSDPRLGPVVRGARGAFWQPHVGMITTWPAHLRRAEPGQVIDLDTLAEMAKLARAVIVGAWDGEGFLIWEPPTVQQAQNR